jgi:RNA polymerase sigma-70 factor (ECF subfamily)
MVGGDETFEAAFDEMFRRARRLARRLLGDPTRADDVAAEALARTYAHWRRVADYEHREAWIARVVTNLAIDDIARNRRSFVLHEQVADEPSDGAVLRVALAEALRSLPRRQRDAVVLRYLADLDEAHVAAALGVSNGTVKTHLHRAVARMRNTLGPGFDPSIMEF